MEISEMVFVAFNKYVVAMDRTTGTILWQWQLPRGGSRYPVVLVDNEKVFVCAMGYTYCLDTLTGALLWNNNLEGLGTGVASIATATANSSVSRFAAVIQAQQASQNAS